MNKKVSNHETIYGLLHSFYNTNKDKLVLNIMIAALFILIDQNSIIIKDLCSQQDGDNTGIAEEKMDAKVLLVNAILQNVGPASTCYNEAGKKEEAVKMKLSYSYLDNMKAVGLTKVATWVVNDLTTDILFLKNSGVTVASIALISDALDIFNPDINRPLEKIKSKKEITTQINENDKINWGLVTKELKPAMKIYMNTDKVMYSAFLGMTKAPKIGVRKHYGTRPAKVLVMATVLDDSTSLPIMNAVTKYVGVRGGIKTDINGVAGKEMPEGAHLGKVTAEGYVPNSFAFTLTELGYAVTIRMVAVVV